MTIILLFIPLLLPLLQLLAHCLLHTFLFFSVTNWIKSHILFCFMYTTWCEYNSLLMKLILNHSGNYFYLLNRSFSFSESASYCWFNQNKSTCISTQMYFWDQSTKFSTGATGFHKSITQMDQKSMSKTYLMLASYNRTFRTIYLCETVRQHNMLWPLLIEMFMLY